MSSFDLKYPDLFSNINNVNYKPSETDPTAEEIKSSINSIFSVIGSAGNETAEAKEEIEGHKKNLEDIKDQKDGVNRTYKRAEKLFEKAEQNAEDVLELIEKLEAESEEAQEYNERLQEQQEIIATNLEIIKDTNSTSEERKEAFKAIKGASDAIKDLEKEIKDFTKNIEKNGDTIKEISEENESLNSETEEVIAEGNKETDTQIADIENKKHENVTTRLTGEKNEIEGEALVVKGTGESALPAGAFGEGARDIEKGMDLIKAGSIRTTEAIGIENILGGYGSDAFDNLNKFADIASKYRTISTEFSDYIGYVGKTQDTLLEELQGCDQVFYTNEYLQNLVEESEDTEDTEDTEEPNTDEENNSTEDPLENFDVKKLKPEKTTV